MSGGFPKLGNISFATGDEVVCYNCKGDGWVTVRIPLKKRSKVEVAGMRSFPNRIECPLCKGAGVRSLVMDDRQWRLFR